MPRLSSATLIALSLLAAPGIHAQTASTEDARRRTYEFDVPSQPLPRAISMIASIAGLEVVYDSTGTQAVRAAAVSGRMTVDEALGRALSGTGFVYRYTRTGVITLERAPNNPSTRTLGPVRVEGVDSAAVAGINGSKDPTATEGTGSYTSGALTIGSKTPQSIKDTPQSVSVLTQQRMQDQNITDFASAMNQATGVSVVTGANGPIEPTFYSRGFEVQRLQVDGGAPLDISRSNNADFSVVPQIDLAMFDHVELLRGSDGLFNGYGAPGGVINLTRKRPLDHERVTMDLQAGSWNNFRTVIDATAPLAFDGKLRGRGVLAHQERDYFYETASSEKTLAYGILEYDLFATTTLSAGFSNTSEDMIPFFAGLPRYQSGADLKLSRDTCLCFPWNRYDLDTTEVFGRLAQAIGASWTVKLNLTHTNQERSFKYGYVQGTVNPVTLSGPAMGGWMRDRASEQQAADLVLDGSFELFGHRQVLVVGANYADVDGAGYRDYSPLGTGGPAVAVLSFNPLDPAYSEPASGLQTARYPEYGNTQWGAYASLRLTFWEPLHLNLGLRYSHYEFGSVQQNLCNNLAGCAANNGTRYAPGEVTTTTTTGYSTHDLSWPPAWSLVYDLSDTLAVYASYSDIYQQQSTLLDHSGQSIDPITGSNIEGGIKWTGRDGRLNATLAVYRVKRENYARFLDYGEYQSTFGRLPDDIHSCCYDNDLDQANVSEGVDAEVTGEVSPGWQLAAGYTYNKNEYDGLAAGTNEGKPLQTILPQHLFKLWTTYQFQTGDWRRRLNVGAGMNAQTKGYYSGIVCVKYMTNALGETICDSAGGGRVPYEFTQGFFAVFAARVAYQIDPRWDVALNVNNLTDRTYYQTVGTSSGANWYGEPRSLTLTVRGQF